MVSSKFNCKSIYTPQINKSIKLTASKYVTTKYYQGKFIPKFPQKYVGDSTQIIYRSSWELKFMNWCDNTPAVMSWSSEEIVIPYKCPTDNKVHRYFPDAKIQIVDKSNTTKTYIVEIKPKKQTKPPQQPKNKTKKFLQEVMIWGKNEAKWKAAKEWCLLRGYDFIILTEDELGIYSK